MLHGFRWALLTLPVALAGSGLTEVLDLHSLPGGVVAAHFQFHQELSVKGSLSHGELDFGTFPRPIVELVSDYGASSIRVSFSKGRWQYDSWGALLIKPASAGIEVEATLTNKGKTEAARWKGLTATLSGLFCGSINLIDDRSTLRPQLEQDPKSTSFRGLLPSEAICTENLTPWSKLFPCFSHAGLASLLNPLKIFDSPFHQFDVDVKVFCADPRCAESHIKLTQNLLVVFDRNRHGLSTDHWWLSDLFDRRVESGCAASTSSSSSIRLLPEGAFTVKSAKAKDDEEGVETLSGSLLQQSQYLRRDIRVQVEKLQELKVAPSQLVVKRFLGGIGQQSGSLLISWHNQSPEHSSLVSHIELLPPLLRPFLHKLRLSKKTDRLIYSPGVFRHRSAQLEFKFSIAPNELVTFELPFEKEFLRYTDYPFDPNRGFDLPGGTTDYIDSQGRAQRIVTPKLLLTMPTPDFTMPYNVITVTSTIIVLFYGTFFNLTFRRFYHGPRPINRLRSRILAAVSDLKRRLGLCRSA